MTLSRFPTFVLTLVIALLTIGMAAMPVHAQQAAKADPSTKEQKQPDGPTLLPPAYEDEMMRLAEILGALHYLRDLCDAKEGQLWRDQMQELLDKEEPTPARRAELIARFNRGYRGFREIYRECTPAAAEAANRYLRQGTRIAAEIPNRYGR